MATPDSLPSPKKFSLSNMAVRTFVAIPLMFLAFICIYLGDWPWALFIGVTAVVGMLEFYALAQDKPEMGFTQIGVPATLAILLGVQYEWSWLVIGALAFGWVGGVSMAVMLGADVPRATQQGNMTLAGLIYVALPLCLTLLLRHRLGHWGVVLPLFITMATDTFAFFGGRMFGRTPMAPKISPKKTMEGLAFGLVGGAIFTLIILNMMGKLTLASSVLALVGPGLAVLGDLLESWLKRHYDVKDSHLPNLNIIPGHGGVLDRADSLLLVSPFVVLYLSLIGMLN